jgi:hypothetical protein
MVTLTWNTVDGAGGYEIYRSDSTGGTYAKVAVISAGIKSHNENGLTSGRTYSYTIRAFKTVDGKPVFSEYSGVVEQRVS